MASSTAVSILAITLLILLLLPSSQAVEQSDTAESCETGHYGECHNRPEALRLKVIAIASILIASALGISLPLFTRSVPAFHPDRNLFSIVKAFASGVILATGYMHVLPDSFDMLTSPCLPENPWGKFPFTTFVAMLSAVFTLMVDSFMMTFYNKKASRPRMASAEVVSLDVSLARENEMLPVVSHGHHGHCHGFPVQLSKDVDQGDLVLSRYRIIAQVLEMGIIIHSVVIGLSLGASQSPCTIRPLVAALCFHQLFEGMGLGGCILQAEYGMKMKAIMVFFFATTTPFGVALGIAISNVYSDNSPTSLIVIGILNASSAGLLNYMALVDLLATDFLGPKLQNSWRLQLAAYAAVLAGVGGMSLMAKWA